MKISFETRYEIWPAEARAKYYDTLYEPYKVRGDQEKIFAMSGQYIYPDRRDGNIMRWAIDNIGFYAIFQPKNEEYDKIKVFAENEYKLTLMSEIFILQIELRKPRKTINELTEIENKIDQLCLELFENPKKETYKFKSTLWFIVGINFANGEIQRLHQKGLSGAKIASHLGNANLRPYITETINNTTPGNKNIYSDYKKMNDIIKYCTLNKLAINKDFQAIYDQLNEKQ